MHPRVARHAGAVLKEWDSAERATALGGSLPSV
jgi:hypothetical protein